MYDRDRRHGMTTIEYTKAKMVITSACNSTGLDVGDMIGVLSSILEEAKAQASYDLAQEVFRLTEENDQLKNILKKKEEEDGNG